LFYLQVSKILPIIANMP